MLKKLPDHLILHTGCILDNRTWLLLAHDKYSSTTILKVENYQYWEEITRLDWNAVDMTMAMINTKEVVMVLGRDGEVAIIDSNSVVFEHIDPKRAVGPFRGIVNINDHPWAYGMKREVYVRTSGGQWVVKNQGMNTTPSFKNIEDAIQYKIKNIGGINTLITNDTHSLLALGIKGEIWSYQEDKWIAVTSPTTKDITDATLVWDQYIYACGKGGALLKRDPSGQWKTINYEGVKKLDFSSIASYKEKLFLGDGHSFRLLQGHTLVTIKLDPSHVVPSSKLLAKNDILLSIAGKELWYTQDGESWYDLLH